MDEIGCNIRRQTDIRTYSLFIHRKYRATALRVAYKSQRTHKNKQTSLICDLLCKSRSQIHIQHRFQPQKSPRCPSRPSRVPREEARDDQRLGREASLILAAEYLNPLVPRIRIAVGLVDNAEVGELHSRTDDTSAINRLSARFSSVQSIHSFNRSPIPAP